LESQQNHHETENFIKSGQHLLLPAGAGCSIGDGGGNGDGSRDGGMGLGWGAK